MVNRIADWKLAGDADERFRGMEPRKKEAMPPVLVDMNLAGAETANGCLVLDRRGTTAERREGELEKPEDFC